MSPRVCGDRNFHRSLIRRSIDADEAARIVWGDGAQHRAEEREERRVVRTLKRAVVEDDIALGEIEIIDRRRRLQRRGRLRAPGAPGYRASS
jgi:hypothetical protein